jgi:transcriptional regulator with XRE-family HTH domain
MGSSTDAVALGKRIRKFRKEKDMTAAELAKKAKISRSYLSELENGKGEHNSPSAQVIYRIGKALGISMSELLGRPYITAPPTQRPASLEDFANAYDIPDSDLDMLSTIQFRGETPRSVERWSFIYNAIKNSKNLDDTSRRRR